MCVQGYGLPRYGCPGMHMCAIHLTAASLWGWVLGSLTLCFSPFRTGPGPQPPVWPERALPPAQPPGGHTNL